MTPVQFGKRLETEGFERTRHPLHYDRCYNRNRGDHLEAVILENVKGGAYRMHLGWNCTPFIEPTPRIADGKIEAESPWFEYVEQSEKSETLDRVWNWLVTTGFEFLADPNAKELHQWITEENILVRDGDAVIQIPRERRLP
ncbi:MAG: hypothetical protein R3F19_06190 [Verrucomicrobiales bacterium]